MEGCGDAKTGNHHERRSRREAEEKISQGHPARHEDHACASRAGSVRASTRGDARQTMKSPYVNEIEPNNVITTSFLVHSKEIRQKKSGEFYLSLMLGDRTGELDSKMWDNVGDVLDSFDRDDFVKVKGLVQVFHNRPQLTIHKLRRMDD